MPVLPEVGSISVVTPGTIRPRLLGGIDHGEADAVLHRAERVEEFELGQDLGFDAVALGKRFKRTSGVAPTVSVMSL